MDVSRRLQELLDQRGWTMYKLAKEADLSWSTVRNIFKRNTDPTISTLEIMCNTLGISLSQFFDVDGQGGLTAEQRRMLDMWATLSERERAAVMEMIELLRAHK